MPNDGRMLPSEKKNNIVTLNLPPEKYLELADDKAARGEYIDALTLLDRALRFEPDNEELIIRRIEILTEIGDFEDALSALFDGFDFEITETMEPAFRCDCSSDRLKAVLVSLGSSELRSIIEEDGQAEIVCRFCNTKYKFGKDTLKELLEYAESKEEVDAE